MTGQIIDFCKAKAARDVVKRLPTLQVVLDANYDTMKTLSDHFESHPVWVRCNPPATQLWNAGEERGLVLIVREYVYSKLRPESEQGVTLWQYEFCVDAALTAHLDRMHRFLMCNDQWVLQQSEGEV